ncbi:MAG: carbon-nitrogen hydrolase family protein [Acidovorax sp.]|nr:carbon-nitrogen hydrolase family protein [Acidovorax sp.]
MKVAALQMRSSPDVAENLRTAQALVREAAQQGAELVALPEYFCGLGWRDTDKLAYAETWGDGPLQQALSQWAAEHGIWLAGGTLPLKADSPDHVFNSLLLFNPHGDCTARYDKVHLFRFTKGAEHYDEAQVVQAGSQPVTARITDRSGADWTLGLSVCYDLRFPELYRTHAAAGADLLLVPSAFTHTTGQAHWEVLLRARAIENQSYVLAPAQGGVHDNGRHTWGHSMLVNPWGQVQAQRSAEGAGVVIAELERTFLRQVRQQLPALEHRVL